MPHSSDPEPEVVLAMRAARASGRSAAQVGDVLRSHFAGGLTQAKFILYFRRAFGEIPVKSLMDASTWRGVADGGLSDSELDSLLQAWIPTARVGRRVADPDPDPELLRFPVFASRLGDRWMLNGQVSLPPEEEASVRALLDHPQLDVVVEGRASPVVDVTSVWRHCFSEHPILLVGLLLDELPTPGLAGEQEAWVGLRPRR